MLRLEGGTDITFQTYGGRGSLGTQAGAVTWAWVFSWWACAVSLCQNSGWRGTVGTVGTGLGQEPYLFCSHAEL